MVIWTEPKACTNCGLMEEGHTRRNCPQTKCFRCNNHGHIGDDCPNTECIYCRRMGHCKSKCPRLERKNRCQPASKTNETPSMGNLPAGATRVYPSLPSDPRPFPPQKRAGACQPAVDYQSKLLQQNTQDTTIVSCKVTQGNLSANSESELLGADAKRYLPESLPHHLSFGFASRD